MLDKENLIEEIKYEIKQQKINNFLLKAAIPVLAGAIIMLAFTGISNYYSNKEKAEIEKYFEQYVNLSPENSQDEMTNLEAMLDSKYASIAIMTAHKLFDYYYQKKDIVKLDNLYNKIHRSPNINDSIKHIFWIKTAYVTENNLDKINKHLAEMKKFSSPYYVLALELKLNYLIRKNNYTEAKDVIKLIESENYLPASLQNRITAIKTMINS